MGQNMKAFSRIFIISIVALAILTSFSCKNGATGLFESIAGETSDGSNPTDGFKYANATNVVLINGTYYAAIGRLWERAKAGGLWEINEAKADKYIDSLVADSTKLYAIVKNTNGSLVGIQNFDGTTWSDLSLDLTTQPGHVLRGLLAANGNILAWTEKYNTETTTSVYSFYSLNVTSFELIPGLSEVDSGVPVNLLYDGTNYRLCTVTKLYAGATVSALAAVSPTLGSTALNSGLAGIAFANGRYFLTTSTGWIYTSADGISWVNWTSGATAFVNTDGKTFSFKTPATFSAGGFSYLIAPSVDAGTSSATTTAKGYRMFTISDAGTLALVSDFSPVSNLINYNTTLELASVSRVIPITDGSTLTLFATTLGYGLWRNVWNGSNSTWSGWLRESDR